MTRSHERADRPRVALVYTGCHRRGGVERVVWEAAHHLSGRFDLVIVAEDVDPLPPSVDVVRIPRAPYMEVWRSADSGASLAQR